MLVGARGLLLSRLGGCARGAAARAMAAPLASTSRENLPAAEQPAKLQRRMESGAEALRVKRLSEHATLPRRGSAELKSNTARMPARSRDRSSRVLAMAVVKMAPSSTATSS